MEEGEHCLFAQYLVLRLVSPPVRGISWKQFYLISSLDILVLGFKLEEVRRLGGGCILCLDGVVIPKLAFPE